MKIVIFKDKKGEWRWKMVAKNGRTVATSGEGYKQRAKLIKTLEVIAACTEVHVE